MESTNCLERLQAWYANQCDGDWEHSYGVSISTLDNPGWAVDIDLRETELDEHEFATLRFERSQNDWLFVSRTSEQIKIRCGPNNLEEGLTLFLNWANARAGNMKQEDADKVHPET